MTSTRRKSYTKNDIIKALNDVKGGMTLASASKKFGIPKSTLRSKHLGIFPVDARAGGPTILTTVEEEMVGKWIRNMSERGFPITKAQLLDSVRQLIKCLKRENPFTNGRPGRHWWHGFLRRNPELSSVMSQNLLYSRAPAIEDGIRGWFKEIKKFLRSKDLLDIDPKRVFTCDELAFFLSPMWNHAILRQREINVHALLNHGKRKFVSTLLTGNAAGDLAPPMVMSQCENIPDSMVKDFPCNWSIGQSENGWMTTESFYEYISNVFHPWLSANSIELPVIVYVDAQITHLTMALSDFCSQNGIELIAIYPNATHVLQPTHAELLYPLKAAWKNMVSSWRKENNKIRLKNEHFAPLLRAAVSSLNIDEILRCGFRACGLHPLNPEVINYNELQNSDQECCESVTANAEKKFQPDRKNRDLRVDFVKNDISK